MTKRNFDIQKLQKKSVRTVWGMIERGELQEYFSLDESWGILGKESEMLKACKIRNLVTVSQILKAIR